MDQHAVIVAAQTRDKCKKAQEIGHSSLPFLLTERVEDDVPWQTVITAAKANDRDLLKSLREFVGPPMEESEDRVVAVDGLSHDEKSHRLRLLFETRGAIDALKEVAILVG